MGLSINSFDFIHLLLFSRKCLQKLAYSCFFFYYFNLPAACVSILRRSPLISNPKINLKVPLSHKQIPGRLLRFFVFPVLRSRCAKGSKMYDRAREWPLRKIYNQPKKKLLIESHTDFNSCFAIFVFSSFVRLRGAQQCEGQHSGEKKVEGKRKNNILDPGCGN